MRPATPAKRHDVTGLILAGGRGLRFGGADKGLLPYRGHTLVQHQLALLAPQVGRVLISANRNLEMYRALGVDVVCDPTPDWPGPLAGWLAGARAAQTPWLVSLPCDTLNVPTNLVQRLLGVAETEMAYAAHAVAHDGPHYALCAFRTALAAELCDALAAGRRRLHDFLHAQGSVVADLRDCALINANQPEALP